jgi:hypothetical protein
MLGLHRGASVRLRRGFAFSKILGRSKEASSERLARKKSNKEIFYGHVRKTELRDPRTQLWMRAPLRSMWPYHKTVITAPKYYCLENDPKDVVCKASLLVRYTPFSDAAILFFEVKRRLETSFPGVSVRGEGLEADPGDDSAEAFDLEIWSLDPEVRVFAGDTKTAREKLSDLENLGMILRKALLV